MEPLLVPERPTRESCKSGLRMTGTATLQQRMRGHTLAEAIVGPSLLWWCDAMGRRDTPQVAGKTQLR